MFYFVQVCELWLLLLQDWNNLGDVTEQTFGCLDVQIGLVAVVTASEKHLSAWAGLRMRGLFPYDVSLVVSSASFDHFDCSRNRRCSLAGFYRTQVTVDNERFKFFIFELRCVTELKAPRFFLLLKSRKACRKERRKLKWMFALWCMW